MNGKFSDEFYTPYCMTTFVLFYIVCIKNGKLISNKICIEILLTNGNDMKSEK